MTGATLPPSPEDRYAALAAALLARGCSSPAHRRGFGANALTEGGRIFATLTHSRRLLVKLPAARVTALVAEGVGARFDANRGRPMKEWLLVAPGHEDDWRELAEEALAFARDRKRTAED